MSEQEIKEGNKLIAEFMGYKEGFPHQMDEFGYNQCVTGFEIPEKTNPNSNPEDRNASQFSVDALKFHSSWDWLMPVVEKIESIKSDPNHYYGDYYVTISQVHCKIHKLNSRNISEAVGHTKLQAAYEAVVDFITWYNQNKAK